jgi:hypothetical protein
MEKNNLEKRYTVKFYVKLGGDVTDIFEKI